MSFNTNFPPINEDLTRSKLDLLTDQEINQLQDYFKLTFPNDLSRDKFACLERLRDFIPIVLSQMQEGDIIISPGDSPYKLIRIIENVYVPLKVKFITFPLSGLRQRSPELDRYLWNLLTSEGVTSSKRLKIMDYSWSGDSFRVITESLREFFNKPFLTIPTINIRNEYGDHCGEIINDLFSAAEGTISRCLPSYYVIYDEEIRELGELSRRRCAVVIAVASLYLLGRL